MLGASSRTGRSTNSEFLRKLSPGAIIGPARSPVLTVQSGDVVEIQTVSGNPQTLERAGLAADQIQKELREIYAGIPQSKRGPGGHLLTGPVAIEGAQPGDVLEVRIREIRMDVPYAYNTIGRNGFVSDFFRRR